MQRGRYPRASFVFLSLAVALFAATGALAEGAAPSGAATPEEAVRAYLGAMQKGDFTRAYDLLTPDMARNQSREAWAREQTAIMKVAEVQITSFHVFPARKEGEGRARVPNLLRSKDKFINQTGADEYELYTVVQGSDGRWRIAQQELVETDHVKKWFPADAAR